MKKKRALAKTGETYMYSIHTLMLGHIDLLCRVELRMAVLTKTKRRGWIVAFETLSCAANVL